MNVLFVDEELDVESLVRSLRLRRPGDRFDLADRFDVAVQKLYATEYDAVVMDLWMPGNNSLVPNSEDEDGLVAGLRLADHVRGAADCVNRQKPFVFLSGLHTGENEEVKMLAESPDTNFQQKPIHPDQLLAELDRVVGDDVE